MQQETIEESGDKLTDDEKTKLKNPLSHQKKQLSENVETIDAAIKNLNDVLTPLTQKLYKQENPGNQTESQASQMKLQKILLMLSLKK